MFRLNNNNSLFLCFILDCLVGFYGVNCIKYCIYLNYGVLC